MTLKRKRQSAIVLALNLVLVLLLPGIIALLQAQEPEGNRTNHAGFPAVYPPPVAPPEIPPFILPFQGPPGPGTWFLEQAYGNTATAFVLRDMFYTAGQGLHFGVDFAAPCGTEVVAIGDGVVVEIDTHGAPPHSLIIDHPNGYTSLYGHLLERPTLQIGQPVKQGDVVALSGDSFETCRSAHICTWKFVAIFTTVPIIRSPLSRLIGRTSASLVVPGRATSVTWITRACGKRPMTSRLFSSAASC
jgi:hypothetical protein